MSLLGEREAVVPALKKIAFTPPVPAIMGITTEFIGC
jgi:hypothetical protein